MIKRRNRVINDNPIFHWLPVCIRKETCEAERPLFALGCAALAENIVADIVGHEKTTITYGLYSGGVSLAVKRKVIDKLAY